MVTPTAPIPVHGPRTARTSTTGLVAAVASALVIAASGPLVKPLLEAGWSVGAALLVRIGVAGLLLSPAFVLAMRARPGLLRRHGMLILGFGLTGVVGCQLFYFSAMQRMPVAVALLVQYLAPVMLVLLAWARTRRRPSRLVFAGSVLAVVGLVLVVDVAGARFDLLGTLLALCAAGCAMAYFLISERTGDDLPPLALTSGGLVVGTAVISLLAVTGVLPLVAPPVDVVLAGAAVPWFVPLALVACIATPVGYALGVFAVPRIGSRVASFIGLSEVLFALGFAWLLLAEAPAPAQFVGGAVMLVGVVLVRADVTRQDARPAARLNARGGRAPSAASRGVR